MRLTPVVFKPCWKNVTAREQKCYQPRVDADNQKMRYYFFHLINPTNPINPDSDKLSQKQADKRHQSKKQTRCLQNQKPKASYDNRQKKPL
jgi:hypothetical protein